MVVTQDEGKSWWSISYHIIWCVSCKESNLFYIHSSNDSKHSNSQMLKEPGTWVFYQRQKDATVSLWWWCTCWVLVSLPLHCLRWPRPLLLPRCWLGLMFSLDLPGSTNTLLRSRSLSMNRETVEEADDDDEGVSDERTEFNRLSFSLPVDPSSQRLVSSTIFSRTRKVSSVCPVSLTTRSTTSCW